MQVIHFFDGKQKKLWKYLVEMKKGATFAALEPAKPLYDAQMCGSFFYLYNEQQDSFPETIHYCA